MRRRKSGVFIAAIAGGVALLLVVVAFVERAGPHCSTVGHGPPTSAGGPVTVEMDASVYAPDTYIFVTATNHSDVPIEFYSQMVFAGRNCQGLEMQRLTGAEWREADAVQCTHGGVRVDYGGGPPGALAPGETSLAGRWQLALSPGTYRVVVRYVPEAALPAYAQDRAYLPLWATATHVPSAPFRVCTCANCD